MSRRIAIVLAIAAAAAVALHAQTPTPNCTRCAEWNAPQQPLRLFGNAYFVGPHGVSSVLITSPAGHVLIDGGLSESAPVIAGHIRDLGFRVEDIKLIVNSHVHYDHAGGIGELQRLSGAQVAASPIAAVVLMSGASTHNDPQYGLVFPIARVRQVRAIMDGETLRAGNVEVTAHFTPGHTPGGTSWTWRSCEGARCLDMVYADSVTPVSADDFLFTASKAYPNAVADFEKTLAFFERVPCDIVVAAHPDAVDLWTRVARRDGGDANALVDRDACKRYAAGGRAQLQRRLESERAGRGRP